MGSFRYLVTLTGSYIAITVLNIPLKHISSFFSLLSSTGNIYIPCFQTFLKHFVCSRWFHNNFTRYLNPSRDILLRSSCAVFTQCWDIIIFLFFFYLYKGVDGTSVDIYNIVDIRSESNKEIAMRISTDIQNTDSVFYTDLNGFQVRLGLSVSNLSWFLLLPYCNRCLHSCYCVAHATKSNQLTNKSDKRVF